MPLHDHPSNPFFSPTTVKPQTLFFLARPWTTWFAGPANLAYSPASISTQWVPEEESTFLPSLHLNLLTRTSTCSGRVQLPQPIPSFSQARLTGQHLLCCHVDLWHTKDLWQHSLVSPPVRDWKWVGRLFYQSFLLALQTNA